MNLVDHNMRDAGKRRIGLQKTLLKLNQINGHVQ